MGTLTRSATESKAGSSLPAIDRPVGRRGPRRGDRESANAGDAAQEGGSAGSDVGHLLANTPVETKESLPHVTPREPTLQRILTWPPEYLQPPFRPKQKKCGQSPRKMNHHIAQLEDIIEEKLTTGYYGLKQMFRASDSKGQGSVTKEALQRILMCVCGYFTNEQFNKMIKRLGFENKPQISLDDFLSCFKDNETVQKEWVSPAQRVELEQKKLQKRPEEHLRAPITDFFILQPHISASFCASMFREKARQSDFDARKLLPPACFKPDGRVVPPQLREALAHLGLRLTEDEFKKLWQRYDLGNAGAIPTRFLFHLLCLNRNGRPKPVSSRLPLHCGFGKKRRRTGVSLKSESSRQPEMRVESLGNCWKSRESHFPAEHPEGMEPRISAAGSEDGKRSEVVGRNQHHAKEAADVQPQSIARIADYLQSKFREKHDEMLLAFKNSDSQADHHISRSDFRRVLQEFGFSTSKPELERFLARLNLISSHGQVNYEAFLTKFQKKRGTLTEVFLTDKFPERTESESHQLSAQELEDKLAGYFHQELLKLLQSFRHYDTNNQNAISQSEFRQILEKNLGISFGDPQWEHVCRNSGIHGTTPISYKVFVSFIVPKECSKDGGNVSIADAKFEASAQKTATNIKPESKGDRSLSELGKLVENFLRKRFCIFDKYYRDMDLKMHGRITKWQLATLLRMCHVSMKPSEVDKLWASLDTSKDNMCSYSRLIQHFVKPGTIEVPAMDQIGLEDNKESLDKGKLAEQVESEKMLKTTKDDQENHVCLGTITSNKSKQDDILTLAKPDVLKNWNVLKKVFRKLDKTMCATITCSEMKDVLESLDFEITQENKQELCQSFDLQKNGRFHYLTFLRNYLAKKENRVYKPQTYGKFTHKLERKLLRNWKSIRRAFQQMDSSRAGFLNVSDFKVVLRLCNISFSEEDLYHLLTEFDQSLTGRISYENFLSQMLGI